MVRHATSNTPVIVVRDGKAFRRPDRLAGEEPMEIRVHGPRQEPQAVAVTMRTPGRDFDLAAGFLFTEGLLPAPTSIVSVRYCDTDGQEQQYNIVTVEISSEFTEISKSRSFQVSSSCGLCGRTSLEDVEQRCPRLESGPVVEPMVLASLPDSLRSSQRVFSQTGGLHAAGLFDAGGSLLDLAEDIGRHNAVDKIVGKAVLARSLPLSERILFVSGRISFEIVQKAALAGIACLGGVSAPSSLAVEAGARFGMTIFGFCRENGFNLYSGSDRVPLPA